MWRRMSCRQVVRAPVPLQGKWPPAQTLGNGLSSSIAMVVALSHPRAHSADRRRLSSILGPPPVSVCAEVSASMRPHSILCLLISRRRLRSPRVTIAESFQSQRWLSLMRVNDIDLRLLLGVLARDRTTPIGEERFLLFRQDAFGTLRKLLFQSSAALGPVAACSVRIPLRHRRLFSHDRQHAVGHSNGEQASSRAHDALLGRLVRRPPTLSVLEYTPDRPLLHARDVAELV